MKRYPIVNAMILTNEFEIHYSITSADNAYVTVKHISSGTIGNTDATHSQLNCAIQLLNSAEIYQNTYRTTSNSIVKHFIESLLDEANALMKMLPEKCRFVAVEKQL